MANFNTHLSVATTASAISALFATSVHLVALNDLIEFIFLGTIGGLLPDIDASNSKPVRLLFTALALISAISITRFYLNSYPFYYLILIASSIYLIVRYLMLALFNRLTTHRGVFHSLLAAIFFALLTVCLSHYILKCTVLKAWLSGLFIAFGYIVHLILDECYSVDLLNKRIKKSFGTALKLWHYKSLTSSLIMALATLSIYAITPPIKPLITAYNAVHWQKTVTNIIAFFTHF